MNLATWILTEPERATVSITRGSVTAVRCNGDSYVLDLDIAESSKVVTFTARAQVPPGRNQEVRYSGTLFFVPSRSGTLTISALPAWSTGAGDAAWIMTAQAPDVAAVTTQVDIRAGTTFAVAGPASIPVTIGRAVSINFGMSCNQSCSGNGTQFTVTLP
jgi:hypothetical protein